MGTMVNLKIELDGVEWTKTVPSPVAGPGGKNKYPHALGDRGYIEGMTNLEEVTVDELSAAGFTRGAAHRVEPDQARVVASGSGRVVSQVRVKSATTTADAPDGDRVGL